MLYFTAWHEVLNKWLKNKIESMGASASSECNDLHGTDVSTSGSESLWGKDLSARVTLPPAVLDLFEREIRRLTGVADRDFLVLDQIASIRFEGRDQGSDRSKKWSGVGDGKKIRRLSPAPEAVAVHGGVTSGLTESLLTLPAQPSLPPPSLLSGLPLDFHLDLQHLVCSSFVSCIFSPHRVG